MPFSFCRSRRAACAAALLFALPAAFAWTTKPVKLLVPAPAGGTMDVVARLVADQLAQELGQPVVVDNKPGAGGAIAVQALLAAPPDGQTLMVTASNVLTEIPHVMKTGFDPLNDVKPVAVVARASMVLVGGPDVPAKDFKSLVAYLKANPGKMGFASYSAGTSSHYAGMILNAKAGLDLQHVPFQGSPPALTQVMGGQIPIMFDGIVTSKAMVAAGKLQAYGVAAKTRSQHLPNVPTFAELGLPELEVSNWLGVVASAKLPPGLTDKIHDVVVKAAQQPRLRDRLVAAGFELPGEQGTQMLGRDLKADFERNAAIVKTYGIQLNP